MQCIICSNLLTLQSLENNQIGDEGAKALAQVLTHKNNKVQKLKYVECDFYLFLLTHITKLDDHRNIC